MNTIYIESEAIVDNIHYLQKLQPHTALFPVIKSNAYGHGLKQMVQILDKTDVPYLVIDSFPEYSIVKKHSDKNMLLLGETLPENYRFFDTKKVTFCIYNLRTLEKLGQSGKHTKVHLFINTGMQREGINRELLPDYFALLQKYPTLEVEGVLSHFHSADTFGTMTMDEQVDTFKKAYYKILDAGYTPKYRYIANSAGMLKMKDEFFNACRPGISIYGYNPLLPSDEFYDKGAKLKPALSVKSKVVAIQEVGPGQGVSYDFQRTSQDATTIAVIPFGYTEGLPRSASNQLTFIRKGKKVHQVGRITMNLTCIDVGDYHVQLGDEIEIISSNPKSDNSLYALANTSNTIIYENLVRLDGKIRRVII